MSTIYLKLNSIESPFNIHKMENWIVFQYIFLFIIDISRAFSSHLRLLH